MSESTDCILNKNCRPCFNGKIGHCQSVTVLQRKIFDSLTEIGGLLTKPKTSIEKVLFLILSSLYKFILEGAFLIKSVGFLKLARSKGP